MIGVIVGVIFLSVIGFFVGRKQSRLEKTLSNSISMIEYYIVKNHYHSLVIFLMNIMI